MKQPFRLVRLPPYGEAALRPHLRSFVVLSEPTGEGGTLSRRPFPASCNSPCDLLAKPGLLAVCVRLTSTFQGQLFHHRPASAGSYAPTARCPPVRAAGLRAFALHPFHQRASRRTSSACLREERIEERAQFEQIRDTKSGLSSAGQEVGVGNAQIGPFKGDAEYRSVRELQ
jgi:hypothetical protein